MEYCYIIQISFSVRIYYLSQKSIGFLVKLKSCNLQSVYTWVSIYNAIAYKVLSDNHKYFRFGSHTCSFTSMINYVFPVWQIFDFTNAYKVLSDSHKYFTFSNHICSFTSMSNCSLFEGCMLLQMPIKL